MRTPTFVSLLATLATGLCPVLNAQEAVAWAWVSPSGQGATFTPPVAYQHTPSGALVTVTIAISQHNGAITLLDAKNERAPRHLCTVPSPSVAMLFTPNGDSLAIGLNAGSVQIRSVRDGALTSDYPVHRNGVRAMALDADGTTLFASGGNKLHKLDLRSGTRPATARLAVSQPDRPAATSDL